MAWLSTELDPVAVQREVEELTMPDSMLRPPPYTGPNKLALVRTQRTERNDTDSAMADV